MRDEGPRGALAALVERARDQLLAAAARPGHDDRQLLIGNHTTIDSTSRITRLSATISATAVCSDSSDRSVETCRPVGLAGALERERSRSGSNGFST